MTYVYWIIIGIMIVAVLFGIKDWILFFMSSWSANGKKFTLLTIIFFILLISPSIVKDLAPNYYGLSVWALIIYALCLLGYRFLRKGSHDESQEG